MDSNQNFDLDSTFCYIYENSKRPKAVQCTKFNEGRLSQFLDKVHNEALLHFEGKLLVGKVQVMQYMKKISKMGLRRARNRYYAEQIQSELLKIYNLTKQFERSLCLSDLSLILDPLEQCALTEDLKMLKKCTNDPKHVLLGETSENGSFPLEMLTNDNCIPITSQNSNSLSACFSDISSENNTWENQVIEERENDKIKINSMQFSPSENSEAYIVQYSGNSNEESHLFRKPLSYKRGRIINLDEVVRSTEKFNAFTIDKTSMNESKQPQFFENNHQNDTNKNSSRSMSKSFSINIKLPSGRNAVSSVYADQGFINSSTGIKGKTKAIKRNIVNITDIVSSGCELSMSNEVSEKNCNITQSITEHSINKEFNDIESKILEIEDSNSIKSHSITRTEISVSNDKDRNLENFNAILPNEVNLKTVLELGNLFDESCNKKKYQLCAGIGKESENKTWNEVHNELEHRENLSRNVHYSLNKLSDKLNLEEHANNEREYKRKLEGKENFLNFNKEDQKKINWESLFWKNEIKLDSISEEFQTCLILDDLKTTDEDSDDDYNGLDWRKLLD